MTNFLVSSISKLKSPKSTIVLGSSSSEVFDYIFGDNPHYHPFWIDGWTARGLRDHEDQFYIANIVSPLNRKALVILCFGMADIFFSLAYKRAKKERLTIEAFSLDVLDGIFRTYQTLRKLGFRNVINLFYNPIPDLSKEYWDRMEVVDQLSVDELSKALRCIIIKCKTKMRTIDLTPLFSKSDAPYIADKRYQHPFEDHHLNFISVQRIIWEHVKDLSGIIQRKPNFHEAIYDHTFIPVAQLINDQVPRPRTCKN